MSGAAAQAYSWQQSQWQGLERLVQVDKLPHALLVSGPAEIGKKQFAMALATRLLCQTPVNGQACSKCKACTLVLGDAHPDFFRVEPDDKGKAISVDKIRELAAFVTKTAMFEGWRIALIEPAAAMTHSAANALLKTLEEPGKQTLLILVHHQERELLATIRSRCQLLSMAIPEASLALEYLEQCNQRDPQELLEAASGRPLRALRIAEDGSLAQMQELEKILAEVAEGTLSPLLAAEQGKSAPLADVLEWMSSILSRRLLAGAKTSVVAARGQFLLLDQIVHAKKLLASKTNPNPQLLLEELLLAWQRLH